MNTFFMRILAMINISINIAGIVCVFLFPPYPYAVFGFALPTLCLVAYIQGFKKKLLIEKKQRQYMLLFGTLIMLSVFFLTLGLTLLVYLEEVQNKLLNENMSFNLIMWQKSQLTKDQISAISVGFYMGNFVTLGFYTREYYLMFWVQHIIHIFRYLKSKVHNYNKTLLSHLPKIRVTKDIKKEKMLFVLRELLGFRGSYKGQLRSYFSPGLYKTVGGEKQCLSPVQEKDCALLMSNKIFMIYG